MRTDEEINAALKDHLDIDGKRQPKTSDFQTEVIKLLEQIAENTKKV